MKTQVIKLDTGDDLISIRDKLHWAKMPRILLVFPKKIHLNLHMLDFLLLKRQAEKTGSRLGIVTCSVETIHICKTLRIPVFDSSTYAQRQDWKDIEVPNSLNVTKNAWNRAYPSKPIRHSHSDAQQISASRSLGFILGLLSIITLVLVFLPSASIELAPQMFTQHLSFQEVTSTDVRQKSPISGITLNSLSYIITGSMTAPATGTSLIPDEYAKGLVRFENLTEHVIGIPSGTVVRSSTSPIIRYVTMEDAVIPAGSGEVMDITVSAQDPGLGGNLLPGEINAIEGDLGTSLTVTNPLPLVGGTERSTAVATFSDRILVRNLLQGRLIKECREGIEDLTPDGATAIQETISVYMVNEIYFPLEEIPGALVSVMEEVECTGLYYARDDLRNLAIRTLDANIPEGYIPQNDSLVVSSDVVSIENGMIVWEITAERQVRASVDKSQTILLITGLDPQKAAVLLNDRLFLARPPVIKITPSWWLRLPFISFRIALEIKT